MQTYRHIQAQTFTNKEEKEKIVPRFFHLFAHHHHSHLFFFLRPDFIYVYLRNQESHVVDVTDICTCSLTRTKKEDSSFFCLAFLFHLYLIFFWFVFPFLILFHLLFTTTTTINSSSTIGTT